MAAEGRTKLQLLCYLLLVATLMIEGDVLAARPFSPWTLPETQQQAMGLPRSEDQEAPAGSWTLEEQISARRLLVGSRAPTCTYNECRGCRYRCSAQEVPVDDSDPMNSAYHYKCICHMH